MKHLTAMILSAILLGCGSESKSNSASNPSTSGQTIPAQCAGFPHFGNWRYSSGVVFDISLKTDCTGYENLCHSTFTIAHLSDSKKIQIQYTAVGMSDPGCYSVGRIITCDYAALDGGGLYLGCDDGVRMNLSRI